MDETKGGEMKRVDGWLRNGCCVAGVGLLVAAAALYAWQREDTAEATIDEPVREGLKLTAGTTETLEFRIHNPRRRKHGPCLRETS